MRTGVARPFWLVLVGDRRPPRTRPGGRCLEGGQEVGWCVGWDGACRGSRRDERVPSRLLGRQRGGVRPRPARGRRLSNASAPA